MRNHGILRLLGLFWKQHCIFQRIRLVIQQMVIRLWLKFVVGASEHEFSSRICDLIPYAFNDLARFDIANAMGFFFTSDSFEYMRSRTVDILARTESMCLDEHLQRMQVSVRSVEARV